MRINSILDIHRLIRLELALRDKGRILPVPFCLPFLVWAFRLPLLREVLPALDLGWQPCPYRVWALGAVFLRVRSRSLCGWHVAQLTG
jgi:hypothetical protein